MDAGEEEKGHRQSKTKQWLKPTNPEKKKKTTPKDARNSPCSGGEEKTGH